MGHNTLFAASWSDVRRALTRHKGKATLVLLAAVGTALVGTLLSSRVYRSEAMLLVRLGRENAVLDATATAGSDRVVAVSMSREDEFNSVVEVLKSRALAEKVVDDLTPDVILERHAAAAGQQAVAARGVSAGNAPGIAKKLTGWLSSTEELTDRDRAIIVCLHSLNVQAVRRSNIVQLTYDSRSPQLAKTVASHFVEVFLDQHTHMYRSAGSREFFAEQTAKLRNDLDHGEQQLRDLKNDSGLASPEEQRGLLVARLSAMEGDVSRVSAARAASQAKVAALREKLASLPATQVTLEDDGYANEGTDKMRAQLYALRVEEAEAASKYTDRQPRMQEVHERTAKARQMLAEEERTRKHVGTAPGRLYQEAQIALLSEEPVLLALQAQASDLRVQVGDMRRGLAQLNENERRIGKLQREIALTEANYRKYATSLEQSRIDTALDDQRISNISLVQSASLDRKPISPHVILNLALGLLAGICGGAGLALACEQFAPSLRSAEDVERQLSLPALATIPRFTREQAAVTLRR